MAHSRDIAINDLDHANMTTLGHEVPGLCFNAGRVDRVPFHVILGQLGERLSLCLLADGLDRRRAIDGFLSAGDIGEPVLPSVTRSNWRSWHKLTVASPSSSSWR